MDNGGNWAISPTNLHLTLSFLPAAVASPDEPSGRGVRAMDIVERCFVFTAAAGFFAMVLGVSLLMIA